MASRKPRRCSMGTCDRYEVIGCEKGYCWECHQAICRAERGRKER